MVEEKEAYKKTKTARPKAVYYWNNDEVVRWFRRHCSEHSQYSNLFQKHHITGRALLRLNDNSLKRMGIVNDNDRDAVLKEILKQQLKTDMAWATEYLGQQRISSLVRS